MITAATTSAHRGRSSGIIRVRRPSAACPLPPTWAYLYRKMVPPLVADGHRVICPDYAGFGRSDKPIDREWYSYDRHVELITELLAGLAQSA